MSRTVGLIAVTAMIMTGVSFSQPKTRLTPLTLLIANPQKYAGQTILVYGFIDQSNPATGSFRLMEAEMESPDRSNAPARLEARLESKRVSLPQNGREAILVGQIQFRDKIPILQVADIVTDKNEIRRLTRSLKRSPRPGDNLGHDAQPSSSISE